MDKQPLVFSNNVQRAHAYEFLKWPPFLMNAGSSHTARKQPEAVPDALALAQRQMKALMVEIYLLIGMNKFLAV